MSEVAPARVGPMSSEVGARVGAILSATESEVQFLGFGVYEGDKLIPNWERAARGYVPMTRRELVRQAVRPLEDWLEWHTAMNEAVRATRPQDARTDEEVRTLAERSVQRARAKCAWTDEQVIEDLMTSSLLTNPCIRLDSGALVWGMECWWGDADRVQAQLDAHQAQGATITLVELPANRFGTPR